MNIFYDDLFHKENSEDIEFIESHGYTVTYPQQPQKMTTEEIYSNLYAYLDNYQNAGFKFIDFPDQLLKMSNNDNIFYCFGKSNYGYFVVNESQEVYIIINKYYSDGARKEDYFSQDKGCAKLDKYKDIADDGLFIIYVNSCLLDFLNSYGFFMASVYELKAHFKSAFSSLSDISVVIAKKLKENIASIDNLAVNDFAYWASMVDDIESVNIMLNFKFAAYKLTNRM